VGRDVLAQTAPLAPQLPELLRHGLDVVHEHVVAASWLGQFSVLAARELERVSFVEPQIAHRFGKFPLFATDCRANC
jgi:hypothetical protein